MSIELTRRDAFAVMTINRPAALNALSFALLDDIARTFDTVAATDARALIITGNGPKAFCAGADIGELQNRSLDEQRRGARRGQLAFARLDDLPMPSVAVINGFAFGGGLELALAATFRLATPNAKMGLPEIKLGLIPGYGGTQRLPRVIGEARALELVMTGRTVEADEALRIGLVNRLVEGDPVEAGVRFAAEFSGYGKLALKFARDAVKSALNHPIHEGLKLEAELSTLAYNTHDANEGMSAFLAKRRAKFEDR